MNSSIHVDNKGKGIWTFINSINFNKDNICLSLHYNGANTYLFVNGTEMLFIQHLLYLFCKYLFVNVNGTKDSEIVASPLCLGNISKDWSTDNMKKSSFIGYVYDFSVGYDAIDVDDIKDIYKYLMKKNNIV